MLIHSTPDDKTFLKIIKERKLKLPSKYQDKEHLGIERIMGLYPSIFFSVGFIYSTSYDFKYSFLYNLNLLKISKFFKKSIAFQCYRKAFRYWEENDPEIVKTIYKRNKTCKEVVDKYYNEKYKGKKRSLFDFWKIEKELIEIIDSYPKKKELIKIFKKVLSDEFKKYPQSEKFCKKEYNSEYASEIIIKKDVSLRSKDFLGFYIRGNIPKKIKSILQKNYSDKIIFDGIKINTISKL